MPLALQPARSPAPHKPNVFVLHCGLDIKRLDTLCKKLGLILNLTRFRREELFAYYMRLDRPRPDLIIIRSHFRLLVNGLNREKQIPTIVVSSHRKPADCSCAFIQADHGYDGPGAFTAYEQLATAMLQELYAA
ncbi:MAG: hypothetical protein ACLFVT_04155 [Syntrophobacteria bacterium]